ncbi:MAG: DUF4493 domain-containing protein [Candidatus Cryptobacteroides sp.]
MSTEKTIMLLAAATLIFAACQKDNVPECSVQEGTIDLNLSSDGEFATKAASAMTDAQKSEYKVTVSSGGTVAYGPVTVAQFEASPRKFAAGTYTVKVENVTSLESEAFSEDSSSYGLAWINGTGSVTVASATNPVTVACTPKNSKVTITKGTGFDSVFESVSISLVSDGDLTEDRNVPYTLDATAHSSAKAAYFKPGTLTCAISAVTTAAYGSASKTFGSTFALLAAQWSKITLSATAEGAVSLTITVDTEYGVKDETVVLNPYE